MTDSNTKPRQRAGIIWLVGCGKMGTALLEGWKKSSTFAHIHIIDPHPAGANDDTLTWHKSAASLPDEAPSIVVFAVKPQQLDGALGEYQPRLSNGSCLCISIAAGKTIAYFKRYFGEHAHVVRAMPNTPALIGQGVTALCSAPTLPASQRKLATDAMKAVGTVEWLESESLMDAVTAISGCGPAYVFLFLQSLIQAGVEAGLPESLAASLAQQTLAGSVALAAQSTKSLEQLRIEVASPGGATKAALGILMQENALKKLLSETVRAAQKRSGELAQ